MLCENDLVLISKLPMHPVCVSNNPSTQYDSSVSEMVGG